MVQPVNLTRFRKQKTRAADKLHADTNAARHGVRKSEKELTRAQVKKSRRDLDARKLDP